MVYQIILRRSSDYKHLEEDVIYLFILQAVTSKGEGEGTTDSARTEEDSKSYIQYSTLVRGHNAPTDVMYYSS